MLHLLSRTGNKHCLTCMVTYRITFMRIITITSHRVAQQSVVLIHFCSIKSYYYSVPDSIIYARSDHHVCILYSIHIVAQKSVVSYYYSVPDCIVYARSDHVCIIYIQSRSPSLRSSGRNARLWDNPLPEARNPG
jgi:hypothetical protein